MTFAPICATLKHACATLRPMSKQVEARELPSRKDRILMALPIIVLIAIALNQPRLFIQENITSWKGGGYGMFATIDKHSWRPVVITLNFTDRNSENQRSIQVDIRSYLSLIQADADKLQHYEDTRSLPTDHNLSVLAEQIASFKYITDQGDYAIANKEGFGTPISTRQIKIDLYRLHYDDATNRGTYELIKTWEGTRR